MANSYENPTVATQGPPPPPVNSSAGGTKAAAIALGGTAALAGAAFLASQYFGDDTNPGNGSEGPVPPPPSPEPKEEPKPEPPKDDNTSEGDGQNPENGSGMNGGEIPTPTPPPHEKTFAEAFAEARAEHGGGGGHFEWKGDLYNTYTIEEWDDLSAQEKDEFLVSVYGDSYHGHNDDSLPVDTPPHTQSVLASNTTFEDPALEGPSNELVDSETNVVNEPETNPGVPPVTAQTEPVAQQPEVEVLDSGTLQTGKGDVDYVLAQVDGHDVLYLDADQDGKLDNALVDSDGDHVLETHYELDPTTHAVTNIEPLDNPVDLSADKPQVQVLAAGTVQTEAGSADYVLATVDGHQVTLVDTNHDGNADHVLIDVDQDGVSDVYTTYNPATQQFGEFEAIHPPTQEAYVSNESMNDDIADYTNDADVSEWA